MNLESHLSGLREHGRRILAPYLTAGLPDEEGFVALAHAVQEAGADMLEIGIPFSDPLMDGPVIQEASRRALEGETRPAAALRQMGKLDLRIPFVIMTYMNPVAQLGLERFASMAAEAGAAGVLVPDLPPEESGAWFAAARSEGLERILMAAPTTPDDRLATIAELGTGFVYCVSLLGVTGVRETLSVRAREVVERVRARTPRPALVGIGISTPAQAAEACGFADGVIVGSALLQLLMDGGLHAAVELVAAMRAAIDGG